MVITEKHILFWESEFSNFYPYVNETVNYENARPLDIKFQGKTFPTSEHLFMYLKALKFNDNQSAELILKAKYPYEAKMIGRRVTGFDQNIWDACCMDCMYTAVINKFSQNEKLKDLICSPKFDGKSFVEASPFDKIWGIGLHYSDANADDETKWKGENKLGKILDKIREQLMLNK